MFRLPSFFFGDPDKLAGALALPLRSPNILATTFESFEAPLKVYTNENIYDIICAVMKARPATAKSPCKRFFKARFPNV